MKILQIIPNLNKGGAERLVLDLSIALNSLPNIELVLVTFQIGNEYTFLSEKINHKHITSYYTPSILGESKKNIDELQKFFNKFKPDIIHSHLFESEILLSQIDLGGANQFVHFHDQMRQFKKIQLSEIFKKETWTNWYEKKLVLASYEKKTTEFITISNDSLQFANKSITPFKKHLLLNGVNLNRFTNNPKSLSSNRIVTIGRLDLNKNQSLAIDVLQKLKEKGHTFYLDILGDGPQMQTLKEKVSQLKLENQVHFHGARDLPEDFLKNAFVYLHTSKSEAFGLTLIEAMASRLPVISTNGGGNAELIENGKNGFCLNEFDAKALAEKIIYLKENKEVYENMKTEAFNYAKKFDINEYANKLLGLYKAP